VKQQKNRQAIFRHDDKQVIGLWQIATLFGNVKTITKIARGSGVLLLVQHDRYGDQNAKSRWSSHEFQRERAVRSQNGRKSTTHNRQTALRRRPHFITLTTRGTLSAKSFTVNIKRVF